MSPPPPGPGEGVWRAWGGEGLGRGLEGLGKGLEGLGKGLEGLGRGLVVEYYHNIATFKY